MNSATSRIGSWTQLNQRRAARTGVLLLLLTLPGVVQAQIAYTNSYGTWYYTTTNDTITITNYSGPGGNVAIPSEINSLPVITIGERLDPLGITGAFMNCTTFTSVTIPNSVRIIGYEAFCVCTSLTNVTICKGVTTIGDRAFDWCTGLVTVTIPNSVTSIGYGAFDNCSSLISATIPNSLTNLGDFDFESCGSLTSVYFQGNAPTASSVVFRYDNNNPTIYYLPGTTGWGSTFAGRPTVLWNPQVQTHDGSFGVHSNNFGFTITGTANIPIAVEGCTNLASASWTPLQTCTLTNGSIYFSDSQWTTYPGRFYRIRSP